jgi:hypothetical protein
MLFIDNMYEIICTHVYLYSDVFPGQPALASLFDLFHSPLHESTVPFTYLNGDPSSYFRGANIHSLSFLVSCQLSSPCCLTHP